MKNNHKEKDLFVKLCRFCAYRERAEIEVIDKMQQLVVAPEMQQRLLVKLKEENFLNQERYAIYFAKGKFRNNNWGKLKIAAHLKMKNLPKEFIQKALQSIDDNEYLQTIENIIQAKNRKYKEKDIFKKKSKIANYLYGKGFESNLIWDSINNTTIG